MIKKVNKVAVIAVLSVLLPSAVSARGAQSNTYVPTIWVDPDGCEHWVFDDGVEGYMTPNVTRDGIPVCQRGSVCLVENSDNLFATGSAVISDDGLAKLEDFFREQQSASYLISGHTDSDGSDEYNLDLGQRRANAVADIAAGVGAQSVETRSYGERVPVADNSTDEGKSQNRRVEIQCVADNYGGKL